MNNIALRISRNVASPSNMPGAYSIAIMATHDNRTDRLEQQGPVYNDRLTYRGVYATRQDAVRDALNYVAIPCKLLELADPFGDSRVLVQRLDDKVRLEDGVTATVIGRRTPVGVWIRD